MKAMIAATCAACVLGVFATPAMAYKHKAGKYYRSYDMSHRYPNATERQRRNSLAFDNGGYYERIQSEQAFGSRSWWMLQNRGGGRR